MLRAELDSVDDVLGLFRENDGVGRLVLKPGQRMPVRFADRLRGCEAIAEASGEVGVERGDLIGCETAFALADGEGEFGHGFAAFEGGKTKV